MNIEEIRKGAPSGAEYYNELNNTDYYKVVDNQWYIFWRYNKNWVAVADWVIEELSLVIKPLY